ncbi:MAG: DUF3488 domain-containing protein [Candidatus Rokubacteria bacterium]|nr:DUF3488 domain-containing protein [Candidatus Rokubacteria bacterium]
MSLQLAFKVSIYLLVLDGIAALVVGGLFSPAGAALVLLAVVGSWWGDRLRAWSDAVPALWRVLALGAAAFAVIDLFYLAESLLDGFVHLLLFVTCYKLYNRQSLRDARDVFILTFFMLVAAAALTVSLGFLLILAAFLVLGIWSCILYQLLGETTRYRPEQIATLGGQWLIAPSFVAVVLTASALTMAFTLVIFFVIPRIGQAALPLKARAGQVLSGFSNRVDLGSFGSIQTDPTVVMRVRFPGGSPPPDVLAALRWRGVAFDHFDGREWRVSRPDRKPAVRGPDGQFVLAPPHGGRFLIQEIYLEPIGSDALFAVPRLLGVSLPAGQLFVDSTESAALSIPNARVRYVAYSELEPDPRRDPRAPTGAVPEGIGERYLQLPRLSPRVAALARDVTRGARDPYEAAVALTEYLRRRFQYTLDLKRQSDLPPLEEFLFVSRAGNCEFFAASLVVLLRTLEIPARVVNGFQLGEWNPYGGYFMVRQRDAHSWVEVHLPGVGWVTLDPSPRAELDAAFLTSQLSHYLDSIRMRWYRYIVNWSLLDQIGAAAAIRRHTFQWRRAVSRAWLSTEWQAWDRWMLVAGVLGVAFLLAAGVRRASGRSAHRRALMPPRRFRAYDALLKKLSRAALVPRPSETAREFASRASLAVPDFGVALREVTAGYERARFGDAPVGSEEERRLLALVESLPPRS